MVEKQWLVIQDMDKFRSEIIDENSLTGNWERDFTREETQKEQGNDRYCFKCVGPVIKNGAFSLDYDGKLKNIGGTPAGSVTECEWNILINHFVSENLSDIEITLSAENKKYCWPT